MSQGGALSGLFSQDAIEHFRLLKWYWLCLAYPSCLFLCVFFRLPLQNTIDNQFSDPPLIDPKNVSRVFEFPSRLIDFLFVFWFFVRAIFYNERRELGQTQRLNNRPTVPHEFKISNERGLKAIRIDHDGDRTTQAPNVPTS